MAASKLQVHVETKAGPVGEVTGTQAGEKSQPPRSFIPPVPGHTCASNGNIDKYYSLLGCDAM